MKAPRDTNEAPAHRFFHAMVVMGGSVALGCGGATTGDETGEPDTSGGSGGHEASDDDDHLFHSGGFHMGGTDGDNPVASGGTTNTGGTIAFGGAGSVGGAGGASWDQGPEGCPSAEWICSDPYIDCASGVGVRVPDGCACDASRPQSPSECAPGDTFVCRDGTESSDGIPLETRLRFDCACVAAPPDCGACRVAYGSGDAYDCSLIVREDGGQDVLCGCAYVLLR